MTYCQSKCNIALTVFSRLRKWPLSPLRPPHSPGIDRFHLPARIGFWIAPSSLSSFGASLSPPHRTEALRKWPASASLRLHHLPWRISFPRCSSFFSPVCRPFLALPVFSRRADLFLSAQSSDSPPTPLASRSRPPLQTLPAAVPVLATKDHPGRGRVFDDRCKTPPSPSSNTPDRHSVSSLPSMYLCSTSDFFPSQWQPDFPIGLARGSPPMSSSRTPDHASRVLFCLFLQSGATICLGLFTAVVVSQLHFFSAYAPRALHIALFGGFLTVFDGLAAAFATWTTIQPAVVQTPSALLALYYYSFALGGPGFSVPMGLLMAGVSVSSAFRKLLPTWIVVLGLVLRGSGRSCPSSHPRQSPLPIPDSAHPLPRFHLDHRRRICPAPHPTRTLEKITRASLKVGRASKSLLSRSVRRQTARDPPVHRFTFPIVNNGLPPGSGGHGESMIKSRFPSLALVLGSAYSRPCAVQGDL